MTHLDASENSKQVRSSDRRVTTTTRRLLHASRCQLPPLAGRFGSSGAARPVRARRLDIFARDALRLASRAGYPAMAPRRDDDARDFYKLKRIDFFGRRCAVVTQNENGPCPLIGIANVLLLRNTISLTGSEDRPETSTSELMSLIAARLLDTNADADDGSPDAPTKLALADAGDVARDRDDAETREALRQNQEQNISDAMAVLPTLATGLDVNVRFRHALDFEFTAELAVFDLLDVTLAHAWCVDPDDAPAARAIGARSYNQLMERLVQLATIAEDAEREERGRRNEREEAEAIEAEAEAEAEEEAIEAEEEKEAAGTTTKTTDANSATETTETTKANVSAPVPSHVSAPVSSRGDDEETAATPPRRNSSEEELLRRAMELSMEESRDSNRERSATTTTISVSTSATSVSTPETVGRSAAAAERAVIEYFLADSASQLTRRGLADARDRIRERELVVFFRNNHFSTVFKLDGALYLLVTDQGYLGEPDVVWEVLASSSASAETGTFVDAHFKPFVCHADPTAAAASARTEEDAQLAAALLASAAEARGGSGAASAEATRQPTPSTRQPPALIPEGFLRVPSDEAPSAIPEGGHGGEGGHGEEGGRGGEGSRGRDSALASAPLASPGDSDYALAMALQAEYEAEAAREEAAARARREEASRATAGREVGGRASAPTRTAASSRPPQRRAPRRKKSAYDECAVM